MILYENDSIKITYDKRVYDEDEEITPTAKITVSNCYNRFSKEGVFNLNTSVDVSIQLTGEEADFIYELFNNEADYCEYLTENAEFRIERVAHNKFNISCNGLIETKNFTVGFTELVHKGT